MALNHLRIVTRKSPLALWQAGYVRDQLIRIHPDIEVELIPVKTIADRFIDRPLSTIGGKGLFVKELEQCILDGAADIAVHSMKDILADLPDGMCLPVVLKREDPRDAFVSVKYDSVTSLPEGACVGTSSLRRQAQIHALRPDLVINSLRGNVGTRLQKLDNGDFDAIILAVSGLLRLGMKSRIREYLSSEKMLPAIGQGAIGIETRTDNDAVIAIIQPLHDKKTGVQMQAERSFSRRLYGNCHLPIAACTVLDGDNLKLEGLVASLDGKKVVRDCIQGCSKDAESLGNDLAEKLLQAGADRILQSIQNVT